MVYPESGPDASGRRIRVLVGKAGLDGHDRGVKVVARILRDAGKEDVDVVGISLLSGAHMSLIPRILALLRAADAGDIAVVVGGVIPDEDVAPLRQMGVAEVFGQDALPDLIVKRVRELASSRPSE